MAWMSRSQTDSSHMALMMPKAAAKPTPSIQVKYRLHDLLSCQYRVCAFCTNSVSVSLPQITLYTQRV